jgi:hypothetical protein
MIHDFTLLSAFFSSSELDLEDFYSVIYYFQSEVCLDLEFFILFF